MQFYLETQGGLEECPQDLKEEKTIKVKVPGRQDILLLSKGQEERCWSCHYSVTVPSTTFNLDLGSITLSMRHEVLESMKIRSKSNVKNHQTKGLKWVVVWEVIMSKRSNILKNRTACIYKLSIE